MKHTMKKLLCMALAIMLLVSAVPVFAMADVDLQGRTITFIFKDQNGNTVYTAAGEQAYNSVADNFVVNSADWWISTTPELTGCTRTAISDPDMSVDGKVTYTVTVQRALTPKVSLIIRLNVEGDKSYDYQVGSVETAPDSMTREAALLKLNGAADSLNVDITTASASKALSGSEAVYSFSAVKKTVTPPTSTNVTLTVNYTGDRSGTVTLSVPANTAVTTTDVANAIKQQLGVSALTVSSFPGITVTGDTTVNGVTVSGINAVNYTLTIKVSGDYTGTASKTVPAGTSVTEADIKAEIKNDLGITSDFNIDVNGTPFTMPANNTTVFATATKVTSNSGTTTNKFPYDVYLNIYKDTLVGSADKSVKITNGIALDGLVTLAEVKNVVKNYYTAKDSDGISYDGLYLAQGNWVADYVADTKKYDSIDAGEMRQTGTVYINVMIGNAKAKSSSTADTSNPKTGDTIFVPVMVMGVTATALAAAYVFGKKRIAR